MYGGASFALHISASDLKQKHWLLCCMFFKQKVIYNSQVKQQNAASEGKAG